MFWLLLVSGAGLATAALAQEAGPAAPDQTQAQAAPPAVAPAPLILSLPPAAAAAAATTAPSTQVAPEAQATPPPLPPTLTPPPLPPQPQFFYNNNGTPSGPFTIVDLGAKVKSGAITSDTLVWQAGTANWVAAKDLPLVAALLPPPATDFSTYLVGTWQSQGPGPQGTVGPATLTVTFAKGGGLSGTYGITPANGNGPATFAVSGTWTVSTVDDKRANLAMNMFILVNGQSIPSNSKAVIEIVDGNSIRDTADGTISTRIGH